MVSVVPALCAMSISRLARRRFTGGVAREVPILGNGTMSALPDPMELHLCWVATLVIRDIISLW